MVNKIKEEEENLSHGDKIEIPGYWNIYDYRVITKG